MKKINSIRKLEQKSSSGNIKATYQLYENYALGKIVDQDEKLAAEYSERLMNLVKGKSLRVTSLNLHNFRGFPELSLEFGGDNNLLVVAGLNGAGKSSVLDAISRSLSWLHARIMFPKNTGRRIEFSDIHKSRTKNVVSSSIVLTVVVGDKERFKIDLSRAPEQASVDLKGDLKEFFTLSEVYRHLNSVDSQFPLPLIAYYGVERALDVSQKDIDKADDDIGSEKQAKFDGYKKSLSGSADFKLFFKWFKGVQDVVNYRAVEEVKNVDALKVRLNKITDLIIKNEDAKVNDRLLSMIEEIKSNVDVRLEKIDSLNSSKNTSLYEKYIEIVSKAITNFVPEVENLRVTYDPELDVLVDKNGVSLSVLQLSQGERSVIALVADIARRLILLNQSANVDPLAGDGIVIIDEIDLHLHPDWQQKVILGLRKTFPNIQFIISTHSPQVISTVPRGAVRVIDKQPDGMSRLDPPIAHTYGEESGDILEAVMQVNAIPPIPERKELDELVCLVDQGVVDSERVSVLVQRLTSSLGSSHSMLQKVLRSINRQRSLKS